MYTLSNGEVVADSNGSFILTVSFDRLHPFDASSFTFGVDPARIRTFNVGDLVVIPPRPEIYIFTGDNLRLAHEGKLTLSLPDLHLASQVPIILKERDIQPTQFVIDVYDNHVDITVYNSHPHTTTIETVVKEALGDKLPADWKLCD